MEEGLSKVPKILIYLSCGSDSWQGISELGRDKSPCPCFSGMGNLSF